MKKSILLFSFLIFTQTIVSAQTVSLIPQGSSWKYKDNGSNQGTAWRAIAFNDSGWVVGNAQLGYGDGDETTVVSYGPSASNKYITTYFRKSFTISSPSLYSSLTLNLLRDDGAVVYINGTEVKRSNMPTGTISYTRLASSSISGTAESVFNAFSLNTTTLVAGTNVVAVEIHQYAANNADISFDLKLDATIAASGCGTPSSLSVTGISSSGATLNWSAVTGATSYTIQYRVAGSGTWTNSTSTTTSLTLSGLTAASDYEFQVQAVCSTTGAFSSLTLFTTLMDGTDSLIASNGSWKYYDLGNSPGSSWQSSSFNDGLWASGNAELGFGDGDEATVLSYGPNTNSKYITTYFRKIFNVANPKFYSSLTLSVVRDDGIVVYLNGNEVYRNNMPTGTVSYSTLATAGIGGTDESAWNTTSLNLSSLLTGSNCIAVEIHQNAVTSSDLSFKARLYGSGTVVPLAVVTRGAYLQKLTPNSVTVRWRTDLACNSRVQFGTTTSLTSYVTNTTSTTEHIVTVNGLTPSTKYYYSIGTTTQVLQGDVKNNFYTQPTVGSTTPVRMWVTGDFGNGSTAQAAVRDAYMSYTSSVPTNLWLWLGDNAYNTGTDAEFQSKVFNVYPDQFKSFPLYPSPGNHDYANIGYQGSNALTTNFPYYSIFSVFQNGEGGGVASGTPKYYSYNYANIHFISLDSYGALNNSGSPMYTWLGNDLAANTQTWTVVYFHHPPYTKGSHDSDTEMECVNMRTNVVPLLESYHVDLVLCGHSHDNQRSFLMKGHYGLANSFTSSMKVSANTNSFTKVPPYDGTVYAVCGTSGQSPGSVQAGWPMPCMYFNNNTSNCSMVIDVNGNNLSAKYLTSTGSIADQFTITRSPAREANLQADLTEVYFSPEENSLFVYNNAEKGQVKHLELLSLMGEHLLSQPISTDEYVKGIQRIHWPLDNLHIADGVYLVRISTKNKIEVKKVFISQM